VRPRGPGNEDGCNQKGLEMTLESLGGINLVPRACPFAG
jgi:hypothetical protein